MYKVGQKVRIKSNTRHPHVLRIGSEGRILEVDVDGTPYLLVEGLYRHDLRQCKQYIHPDDVVFIGVTNEQAAKVLLRKFEF